MRKRDDGNQVRLKPAMPVCMGVVQLEMLRKQIAISVFWLLAGVSFVEPSVCRYWTAPIMFPASLQ